MTSEPLAPQAYFNRVKNDFLAAGDPMVAQGQMAYMRHQFDFFGLKMPAWMGITKKIHQEYGIPKGEELQTLAALCFDAEHRELQYFALETVQTALKKPQPEDFIDFLESLILQKSWWDSVDWLAKLVGIHFRQHPALIKPVTERWMASGNLWLQRVSIIFQLSYRAKTDTALLFEYILRVCGSKEFFLQKACGWALRQHAKTDPEIVTAFIQQHKANLAPLTVREGMKRMDNPG